MSSAVVRPEVVDVQRRNIAAAHARKLGVVLPTFSQLANASSIPSGVSTSLSGIGPDQPDAKNLWRIHWYNGPDRESRTDVPGYIVLPPALTGVKAPILVMVGRRFPMIGAHKVLPAYSVLAAQLVTGLFDPSYHRAVWPSTGNYCRGGVAVSRILGCRGIAVLPAGMSRERFDWLETWVSHPDDIIRTPGTESNVKEIYDKCLELQGDAQNVILNQFSSFANYVIHYACTGQACEHAFSDLQGKQENLRLAAFVSATGSAGTIAAGDYLKKRHGTKIAAVEAVECPTMLSNGYGEHNIQGIGDKHIPFIHNVMNTDIVIGVSDRVSDCLNVLFGTDVGRKYLQGRRKLDASLIAAFDDVGISGFANIAASIKLAKHLDYGPNDVIVTIATDSATLYDSERDIYLARHYSRKFDEVNAGEIFGAGLESIADDHVVELTHASRRRIFNLGYYTWVEQQGISAEDFEVRKDQSFWEGLVADIPAWDHLIEQFNQKAGAGA
jgi:cysteine synthase A